MKKVFITRRIPQIGLDMLKQEGISVTEWLEKRELTQEELIAACKEHDALLTAGYAKMDERFFKECSHLKVVALMSVGYDHVNVEAAKNYHVPVSNTPGVLSGATADTAFLLMLATSRKAFFHHKRIARGEWGFFDPTANLGIELGGKTLGIFGLGNIGYEMARRCVGAYDMKVIYHNRSHNEKAEKDFGAYLVSFDELLQQSDVLSIHSNFSPETKELFNKDAFRKMKPNAIFINTGRGGIHNEKDLKEALDQKWIWGAGLDVTNPEPMAPNNPLLDMPNVCVLPHIGTTTEETRNAMAQLAAQNVVAGLQGKPLKTPVY